MSSAGHILDMIRRIRQNKSLRASNRQKFKGDNRETIHTGTEKNSKATFKDIPEKQVKASIKRIQEEAKSKRRKELVFYVTFSVLVAAAIFYALLPSNNYSANPKAKSLRWDGYAAKSIEWGGKASEPLKIPFSNFLYVPVVRSMEYKVEINRTYRIFPPNMVVDNTRNILFFDKDSIALGKLLPQNGSISFMLVGPDGPNAGPKKIVYSIAEKDSDDDGIVAEGDRHFLYISDLNGKHLTKITDRGIRSFQWINQGKELLIRFSQQQEIKDSMYGVYHTETKQMMLTNKPDKED
ncbi:hypothetical protein WIW50_04705 [Flavobacteriaceae bacterium 3-367]|uniref:hypothetical protein n=1 Tax=Eudoraea algarum TaxID=3417568 RepID=UPI003295B7C6